MSARTAPPVPGAPAPLRLPAQQRFRLTNGLPVVLVERHDLPVVDVRLVVRTGAAADSPDVGGRMTLTADMLDEGTRGRAALDIADELEYLGAELRISASWDATTLALHVLAPRLEAALELLADVLLRPTFPAGELERKRRERLARLVQLQDEPEFLASNAFAGVLYGADHPYGVSTLGTARSVAALERARLVEAYDRYYHPDNAFMVVAGAAAPATLRVALESHFGGWSGGGGGQPVLPAPTGGGGGLRLVPRPGAAQSEIRVGQVALARDTPDYFPLLVMNTVLGGSFTSRLNMNLRQEKGFTYGAGSTFDFRRGPGPFVASAAVDTGVTAEAVGEFLRELRRMRDEVVPEAELQRAKHYIVYGMPRRFETTGDVVYRLADAELHGLGPDYYDRYVDEVLAVDAQDVQRVARRHLDPARWAVVVAGDPRAVGPALSALDEGPVVVLHNGKDPS